MDAAAADNRAAASSPPSRFGPILRLGLPLVGFYLIQNAASIAIVAMLGKLGNAAIAGVGVGGAVYTAICALLWGIDTGVQAVVARTTGAGRNDRIAGILLAAYAAAFPLAAFVGASAWSFGPNLIALILPDHAAASVGGAWIAMAAPSTVLLAATLPINAVWIGSGRPALAMLVTALLAPLQIGFSLLFVLGGGPLRGMGATGGALAMDVTMSVGVVLQFTLAFHLIPGFLRRWPSTTVVREIAYVGWPISVQQSLLQVALMAVFAIVSQLGAASAAIINVLLTLTTLAVQTQTGLGVAAATLVGQSLGRKDVPQARAWGWRTTVVATVITVPMGLALTLAPHTLLSLFLRDPATLAMAIVPAKISGACTILSAATCVLGFALRGAGATKVAAAVPFLSLWIIQLPLMAWIGLALHCGLIGILWIQMLVTAADALGFGVVWAGRSWTGVKIGVGQASRPLPRALRRVAILGGAGAGKSTLAVKLSVMLKLPVLHLDRLAYGPEWAPRTKEEFRYDVEQALHQGSWIVEGTYDVASALTLPAADLVIWLDQPVWRRMLRAWRKSITYRNRPRADRPDDCEEQFGLAYARMVASFGAWSPDLSTRLEAAAGGRVLRLQGDASMKEFLGEIVALTPAPPPT